MTSGECDKWGSCDGDAILRLLEDSKPIICRIGRKLNQDPDELYQLLAYKIFKKIDEGDKDYPFSVIRKSVPGWVRSTVLGIAFDELDEEKKISDLSSHYDMLLKYKHLVCDDSDDGEISIKMLMDAFDKLSSRHQEIIRMRIMWEMPNKAVAKSLNIHPSQSSTRLTKAINKLRRFLGYHTPLKRNNRQH